MKRLSISLLVGPLLVHSCAFAELPRQVPERTHRVLVIPQTRLAPRSAHAPAVVDMQAVRDVNPARVRAFAGAGGELRRLVPLALPQPHFADHRVGAAVFAEADAELASGV